MTHSLTLYKFSLNVRAIKAKFLPHPFIYFPHITASQHKKCRIWRRDSKGGGAQAFDASTVRQTVNARAVAVAQLSELSLLTPEDSRQQNFIQKIYPS